jgi:hypothetical protein
MNFPTTFLAVLSLLCFDAFQMVDMLMTNRLTFFYQLKSYNQLNIARTLATL